MKRFAAIFALAIATASTTEAAVPAHHRPLPRTRSGYEATIIVRKNNHVTYRTTYPGKINGFPPPAFLYYGYPQSGFSYGVGF
jgi:hypothetical protein